MQIKKLLVLGMFVLSLTACEGPQALNRFIEDLSREWNALITIMQGGRNPLLDKKKSKEPGPLISRQVYLETVQEMIRVLYKREPLNSAEFLSSVLLLEQGASLEGVYNGMTHSSKYRDLEKRGPASQLAVKTFVRELMLLEAELPEATVFGALSGSPLPLPVEVGVSHSEVVFPAPKKETPLLNEADYTAFFASSNFYTLKRVLSDEAIKVVARRRVQPKERALWYSKWAVVLAGRGVHFGLELRNLKDEKFHFNWAMNATEDRILWEVLNRINRIMNEVNS